jgi:hypothetical protein
MIFDLDGLVALVMLGMVNTTVFGLMAAGIVRTVLQHRAAERALRLRLAWLYRQAESPPSVTPDLAR